MKNFEDYKRFGLDYFNDKIKIETSEGYRKSGRVKILDCGCVYLDDMCLEEPCIKHIDIEKEKCLLENQAKAELEKLDLKSLRRMEELLMADEEVVASKNILREKIKNIRNVKTLKNLEDLKK